MRAIVVRKISAETHRALRVRARQHGRSTAAEIRAILDGAVRPATHVRLGSALATLAEPFGGLDLEIARDKRPADEAAFQAAGIPVINPWTATPEAEPGGRPRTGPRRTGGEATSRG